MNKNTYNLKYNYILLIDIIDKFKNFDKQLFLFLNILIILKSFRLIELNKIHRILNF